MEYKWTAKAPDMHFEIINWVVIYKTLLVSHVTN